jgi:hypothetical protein
MGDAQAYSLGPGRNTRTNSLNRARIRAIRGPTAHEELILGIDAP